MTRQTWKHFAFSCAFLSLVLSASLSLAQGKLAGPKRVMPKASQPAKDVNCPTCGLRVPGSPSYTFTLIDFPGEPDTEALGMNLGATSSKMEIVGDDNSQLGSGFLLRVNGTKRITETFNAVNFPGFSSQEADGINDSGQIVGTYYDSASKPYGYELNKGKFAKVDVPFSGANGTAAADINNLGDIVGWWLDSSNAYHGFLLSGGVYTSLDYPGATSTFGCANNTSGAITGAYTDSAGNDHGFLLNGGSYSSIDVPGAAATSACGINDAGDIVGHYCTATGCPVYQGFVLSGGVFTTLDVPNATDTLAFDINNNGVIVGGYADCAGAAHGFIASP